MNIKRWWKTHKWVDITKYKIIPYGKRMFVLSDKEQKLADDIRHTHKHKFCSYRFHPTGIGDAVELELDGTTFDITDYESW